MTGPRATFEEHPFGRYRLLERLGQGGMAEVFKAKSFGVEGFEKVVVIKRILPHLARDKAFVDMFVHEAKLAVRLSHANIVQVFDLGRVEPPPGQSGAPSYFMAMEHVAGLDLATLLERCKAAQIEVPVAMAVYVAAEVAKGLEHAHRRRDDANQPLGIVHRDISPQNVLVSWEGEVKVTDFGIAKARDSLDERADDSKVLALKGKLSYMSPEQALGQRLDHRSDIFSLGTVLYEMVTGVNPFRGPNRVETLRRVRAGEHPPLEVLRHDASPALCALVARAMAFSPDDRPPDAGRLYEHLLAFLYQTGQRFGASELSELLARLRVAGHLDAGGARVGDGASKGSGDGSGDDSNRGPGTHDESEGRDDLLARECERTPVELPTSAPSLRMLAASGGEAPTTRRAVVAFRREVAALVLSTHAGAGRGVTAIASDDRARARAQIERHGGQLVDRASPGELAAVFGLGEPDARDAEYAVRAALAALQSVRGAAAVLGAGVHSGRVVVSDAGEVLEDDLSSLLLGTALGLAGVACGRVALSPQAARHVRGLFALEAQPPAVPGGPERFVVGGVRAPEDTYGKFVGRRDELAKLGTTLGAASKRQLQLITITGPAGIGKTRLLHEIDRRLRRGSYNVGFYVAACPPRGREVPLSAITAMLQQMCAVQEGDPPERFKAIEPNLRALGLLDDEVEAFLAQLGLEGASPTGLPALRSGLVKTLTSLADDRVHVFAWDDAHALDEASAQLLSAVARRLQATRTALVFAGRDGLDAPVTGVRAERVDLGALGDDDAASLLRHRLGVETVPAALSEFFLRRAGGHPLFVEELLKDLFDAGAVVVEGGEVTQLRLDGEMATPRPLRSLIAGRVARLERPDQAALELAAVLGEPIDHEVLAHLLGGAAAVAAALAALERNDLLRRAGPSSHAFATPLLRDVVLDTMPPRQRRASHGLAAQALEAALGARADEQADRVAGHYLEAGDREQAARMLVRSARRRLATRRFEAAAGEALRALDLLEVTGAPGAQVVDALRVLSSAVDRTRVARHAPHFTARLLARLDAGEGPDLRVAARVEVARVLGAVSRFDEALAVLAEAHALSPGALGSSQRVALIEAQLHARQGDFGASLRKLEEARAAGLDRSLERRATLLLAQSLGAVGERDRALALLDEVGLAPDGDLSAEAERLKLRALVHYFAGEFEQSVALNERAIEQARQGELAFDVAICQHNAGDSLLLMGDDARAYVMLSQSLDACETFGLDRLAEQNRMYLGFLDALRDLPGGEAQLRAGIAYAAEHGFSWDLANGQLLLGRLLLRVGLVGAAAAELEVGRALAERVHNRLVERLCREALAHASP